MGTGNLEIFYNKVRNLLKYGYPSNTHIQLKKSKKISPENCANLLWEYHDPPQDVAQQKGYLRGLWSYAANLSFKAHSHILILTYILESLEAAPPVTLATSSADNSVLSSSSCFKSSSFFFPRSSWAFTFTCSAINQNNPTNETFANLLLFRNISVKITVANTEYLVLNDRSTLTLDEKSIFIELRSFSYEAQLSNVYAICLHHMSDNRNAFTNSQHYQEQSLS